MSDLVTSEECRERNNAVLHAVQALENRLFHDNGTLSIQSRINKHSDAIGTIKRLMWIAIIALASAAAAVFTRG